MARELYIVIACDTDPDRQSFNPQAAFDKLQWRGLLEGIPRGKDALADIHDSSGKPPVITWCLRADHQIREYTGTYDFVPNAFREQITALEASGDEIGWHPHFWRRDSSTGKWYQELADVEWQVAMLRDAHKAYATAYPSGQHSVRMGWIYHNSRTMQTLDSIGVRLDLSASPGLKLMPRSSAVKGENFFDWSITPDDAYHPSREDYRRPSQLGESSLRIWESPCFVSRSRKWSVLAGTVLSLKMKSFSPFIQSIKRPTHFVNISGKSAIFKPLLADLETKLKTQNRVVFGTYFHADEWLPTKHPFYSLEWTVENLRSIIALCKTHNARVTFIRAKDSLTLL